MNNQICSVFFQAFPFDLIHHFMTRHQIVIFIKFHMDTRVPFSRTIIMYHQIVTAKHHGIGHNFFCQFFSKIRFYSFSEKWGNRISRQSDAAPENKDRHQNSHDTIYFPSGCMLDQSSDQNRRCRQHIISAVCCGSYQHRGINSFSHPGIKDHHPCFYQNRCNQDNHGQKRKFYCHRMKHLLHRTFCQLESDKQDHHRHRKACQILEPCMSVRVFFICRFLCQFESGQRHDGTCRIGQVV